MKVRKLFKRTLWTIAIIFMAMNVVAFFHAYKFTHFTDSSVSKTKSARHLNSLEKVKVLLTGIDNPRPTIQKYPAHDFKTIHLESNKMLECWSITTPEAKGTVVLFHGYGSQKSGMLDKADEFLKLGYNTFLVDFMGAGGSEGNQTSIGFHEAKEVKTVVDYLAGNEPQNIYLFGTSLGAVAILKAIDEYDLMPQGIIIECPFGSLYTTTCARFRSLNAPVFPMAALLVFWGGVQNDYWGFSHNPTEYAKGVSCPTLLLYGEKDEKVSREEIDEIYANLAGRKILKTYANAGHENYLNSYHDQWVEDVQLILT
jgi:uncharacterized protein